MDTSKQYEESIVSPLEPLEKVERVRWYEDPVYIKMCDCEEIQESAPAQIFIGDTKNFYIEQGAYSIWRHLWLPRQDQLQAMVADILFVGDAHLSSLAVWFGNFVVRLFSCQDAAHRFTSMDQLWLSFIMSELHSKKWNGEAWVNAKD